MTLSTKNLSITIIVILFFISCNSPEKRLSPVDITDGVSNEDFTPLYNDYYYVDNFVVLNNGDLLDILINDCFLLIPDKDEYLGHEVALKNILIKSPSEHTVKGKSYPLEIQFIHYDTLGKMTNVAVFVENGDENTYFNPILNNVPSKNNSSTIDEELDVYSLFPQSPEYWYYLGSTTTGEYADSVKWFVMKEPVTLSDEQIKKVVDAIGENQIDIVELGNREIIEL